MGKAGVGVAILEPGLVADERVAAAMMIVTGALLTEEKVLVTLVLSPR